METKNLNEELRERLAQYQREHEYSQRELGLQLGCSDTVVSRYLSGKPLGDVGGLEARIEDVLKAAERRRANHDVLFPTAVTRAVNGALELVRKTSDVGLLCGPAGIGKTCGIALYMVANPTALAITLTRWDRDDEAIARLLFGSIETRGWDRQTRRMAFVSDRLDRSNRLVIVDNAHRATGSALALLFDLHDATGCPIALIGNPEVESVIRRNDQQFSRIGLRRSLQVSQETAIASAMIAQVLPGVEPGPLLGAAAEILRHRGHVRALRKELVLAREIQAMGREGTTWSDALAAAHRSLVRDYELPAKES